MHARLHMPCKQASKQASKQNGAMLVGPGTWVASCRLLAAGPSMKTR